MIVRAVIAVRGGKTAKSRCGPTLSSSDRSALVTAMLRDMLAALLGSATIDEVEVITPTPALASAARTAGATAVFEAEARGINAAFDDARRRLLREDQNAIMLALPGDLPLLNPDELAPALEQLTMRTVTLVPATADNGTGAVMLYASAPFSFRFGSDSFHRHWDGALAAGLAPLRLNAPSLGLDIDRPEDIAALLVQHRPSHTSNFLTRRAVSKENHAHDFV